MEPPKGIYKQIISSYEDGGLSPPEIAEILDFAPEEIEGVLEKYSEKYRHQCIRDTVVLRESQNNDNKNKEITDDISEEIFQEVLRKYISIARWSEVDSVAERACKTIIEWKRGLFKKPETSPGDGARIALQQNILVINNNIEKLRPSFQKLLGEESNNSSGKVVNV